MVKESNFVSIFKARIWLVLTLVVYVRKCNFNSNNSETFSVFAHLTMSRFLNYYYLNMCDVFMFEKMCEGTIILTL